jgi:RNA polymerase sigma factor (TIGR02999 family)
MDFAGQEITVLLNRLTRGNANAESQLMPLIYHELKRLANSHLRHERPGHTLQATALVNEAYLRLVDQRDAFATRAHFFVIASQMMRRVLLDYARQRNRLKRGSGETPDQLTEVIAISPETGTQIQELDAALAKLEKLEPRQVRVVELRYFAGLAV